MSNQLTDNLGVGVCCGERVEGTGALCGPHVSLNDLPPLKKEKYKYDITCTSLKFLLNEDLSESTAFAVFSTFYLSS